MEYVALSLIRKAIFYKQQLLQRTDPGDISLWLGLAAAVGSSVLMLYGIYETRKRYEIGKRKRGV